MDFREFHF
jgi:transposase, IS5 family